MHRHGSYKLRHSSLCGISSDETKYYYVVASLSSSSTTRVVSLLEDPPVSLLPALPTKVRTRFGPPLEAANSSVIQTYGKRRAVLCFHGRQFTLDFVMAKVAKPLLGTDFLCANGLLVDVKNCKLVNAEDFGSFPCTLSVSYTVLPAVATVSASGAGSLLFITDTLSERRFLCDTGAQHLVYISEFTTDIQHVAGKRNVMVNMVHVGIDYARMVTDQVSDPDVQAYRTGTMSLQLADVSFDAAGASLCDISTGQPRPVIPRSWRRRVFDAIHGLSHLGRKPSQWLVAARFVWHGLGKDFQDWVNTCVECQRAKVHCYVKVPLETFKVPERWFFFPPPVGSLTSSPCCLHPGAGR
ncbi:hypothetical protein AAFF_G00391990 [Aldrovandia affinis]|uniref:Integrase zinc-binding domain-containing protein n=1 Tax=Aldrovandia affinis TaxID=143900 RepID=A0AAD7WL89_9TELE|nr:hypothetical protein AAFF_G00391990 [Aldrovandia affinis]